MDGWSVARMSAIFRPSMASVRSASRCSWWPRSARRRIVDWKFRRNPKWVAEKRILTVDDYGADFTVANAARTLAVREHGRRYELPPSHLQRGAYEYRGAHRAHTWPTTSNDGADRRGAPAGGMASGYAV